MDLELLAVVGIVALALPFDVADGFHDAVDSVSTVVATRVLQARHLGSRPEVVGLGSVE